MSICTLLNGGLTPEQGSIAYKLIIFPQMIWEASFKAEPESKLTNVAILEC